MLAESAAQVLARPFPRPPQRRPPDNTAIRVHVDEHGTRWYYAKTGAKAHALREGRIMDHRFFITRERPNPHDPTRHPWRSFASFPNAQAYYDTLDGRAPGTIHDYEILAGPCRLMLDIDAVMPARDDAFFAKLLGGIEAVIRALLCEHFGIDDAGRCVNADGSRAKGAGAYKHSHHLSFPGIVFEDTHIAMNAYAHRYLIPTLRAMVPFLDVDLDRLDERIFTKERDWRLPGSCKVGGGADGVLRMANADDDRDLARCSGLSKEELERARPRVVTRAMVDALPQPRVFTWMSQLQRAVGLLPSPGRGVVLRPPSTSSAPLPRGRKQQATSRRWAC